MFRHLELRTLDREVAVSCFNWRLLRKGLLCYPFPEDWAREEIASGWEPFDRTKGLTHWTAPEWLPFYSGSDVGLLFDRYPKVRYRSFQRESIKQKTIMDWHLISGGGVVDTEWNELAPGVCIHALKIAKATSKTASKEESDVSGPDADGFF